MSSSPRSPRGWEIGHHPGIIGEIGPTSRGSHRRRSGSIGGSARGAPDRPRDHDPRASVRPRPRPAAPLREEGADPGRVIIGHADSYPVSSTTSRSSSAARTSSSTSSACLAEERHGEGRAVELLRAARARPRRPGPPQPGRVQRLAAQGLSAASSSTSPRRFCPPPRRRPATPSRDDNRGDPAAAPDGRVARPGGFTLERRHDAESTLPARATLIGQPSLVASAAALKSSADMPGTRPLTVSALDTTRQPARACRRSPRTRRRDARASRRPVRASRTGPSRSRTRGRRDELFGAGLSFRRFGPRSPTHGQIRKRS